VLGEHGRVLVCGKEHVQEEVSRANSSAVSSSVFFTAGDAARRRGPRTRRERTAQTSYRVVVDAMALMGIGPGPVEDVFAVE